MSVTLSVGVQFCKHSVYVGLRVCVCLRCFCNLYFCKSCKTANIHLLYKVSCFSPTITFGFHSFLHPVFPSVLLGFHSCHTDCHIYTVDVRVRSWWSLPYTQLCCFDSHVLVNLLCDAKKKKTTKFSYAFISVIEVHTNCSLALIRPYEQAGAENLDCSYM